ncbi:6-phosphogluconolactonase [Arthrobotrys entomopaga]|nr:6-phosphogluconolactonase [Arthrobotrys entomopaga]
MVGIDYIRRLAVRALATQEVQKLGDDTENPRYSSNYLSRQDILLSVGTYGGDISILKYNPYNEKLSMVSTYHEDGFQASWQIVHPTRSTTIYSVDEGNPGGIVSFNLDLETETLSKIARADGINGTVSMVIHETLLIAAAYSGHTVQTFKTDQDGGLSNLESFTYSLRNGPGPNKERQEASHPHQVVLDSQSGVGDYAVVPDLGADLLRIYRIDGTTIKETQEIAVDPGQGPRHGVFVSTLSFSAFGTRRFYYLANELQNTVTAYEVKPGIDKTNAVQFKKMKEYSTLPHLSPAQQAAMSPVPAAAEVAVSSDNRFLYVSNRFDRSFPNRKFGPSDSIALFEINADSGRLTFVKLLEAGGLNPRHFSIHSSGHFAAVALQDSNSTVVFRVDPKSGEFIATDTYNVSVNVPGKPVCVTWMT